MKKALKKNQGILLTIVVMLSVVLLFGLSCVTEDEPLRIDDWNYRPGSQPENGGGFLPSVSAPSKNHSTVPAPAPEAIMVKILT